VRITQFQSHTGENLRESVSKLQQENERPLKGLVLDLRNNPGGVLSAAVAVSDAFLTKGTIVYTEGRMNEVQLKFNAKPSDILSGAPLVVLVNGGSASAAEIVAGALQDHKRAIIMGNKTFGKGSVQTILPMDNGSALKLTTALYYTPSGTSIQAKGINPDIELKELKVASADAESSNLTVKEADLTGHLENGTDKEKNSKDKAPPEETTKEEGAQKEEEGDTSTLAQKDFGLYQALNLLKGLSLLQHGKS
jgi:carboxyl-terminal processing protease